MFAVHCGAAVRFEGQHNIAEFASSNWACRAFCKDCGTHLYYKFLQTGDYYVPAGVFQTQDFEIASQIYIDRKPAYYELANQTPTFTEEQFLAQFTKAG
jgi:hypothetical protein